MLAVAKRVEGDEGATVEQHNWQLFGRMQRTGPLAGGARDGWQHCHFLDLFEFCTALYPSLAPEQECGPWGPSCGTHPTVMTLQPFGALL